MAQQPEQHQPRFIKLNHVRTVTALSTSEIYRRIAAGTFPAQIALGPKSVVWLESEVVHGASPELQRAARVSPKRHT